MSNSDAFPLEIDHIVIYVADMESAVEPFKELGVCVHSPVHHIDYGTVSSLIFFENMYLEIVSIENERAVKHQAMRTGFDPLRRIQGQKHLTSPFGIGLRYTPNSIASINPIDPNQCSEPIESDLSIYFDANNMAKPDEPFCFVVSKMVALTDCLYPSLPNYQQWVSHPLDIRRVTDVRITVHAYSKLSNAVTMLSQNHVLTITQGLFPCLDLTFDERKTGRTVDARPFLPLVLKY
ncbi:MAG: VOC family protein [Elainellaceae cyanobacterium]